MRKNPTPAEEHVWRLVGKNGLGMPLERQKIIGGYIVDFFVSRIRMILEIDGGYHEHRQEYDARRTNVLKSRGNWVIRLSNEEALAMDAAHLKTWIYEQWGKQLRGEI